MADNAGAINWQKYNELVRKTSTLRVMGKVSQVIGLTVEVRGIKAALGELCQVYNNGSSPIPLEVVGFRNDTVLAMPLGELRGIAPGSLVAATGSSFSVMVSKDLLGRVLDGLGRPLLGGELQSGDLRPADNVPINPLKRRRIEKVLPTGIKAIDTLLTCGEGQRVGIFSGSGVGKSTLLGMVARQSEADVNVIGLVGERGREVGDFLERDLGEEGLRRSVVVAATSDQQALVRIKGALVAATIAEYFRDQGLKVLLMMDSITRLAMAQREVGLAIGEPPATKGYTPSVFAMLPRLLERAGIVGDGSITGFYTVLVEGDDFNEPVADAVRGILDGHIVLSRRLAAKNHFPSIDVLDSVSRLMPDITSDEHRRLAGRIKDLLATYREAEDLINIGAYVDGSDPKVDEAKKSIDKINAFLRQDIAEEIHSKEAVTHLKELLL
jgi:flagellum-specific ATP synthase